MERRSFIHKSGLGALALVLVPWHRLMASNSASTNTFPIPDGGGHVRHGMFTSIEKLKAGPLWLEGLQRDVFYANGLSPSTGDLQNYRIGIEGQWINLSCDGSQVTVVTNGNTLTVNYGESLLMKVAGQKLSMEGNRVKLGNESEWLEWEHHLSGKQVHAIHTVS